MYKTNKNDSVNIVNAMVYQIAKDAGGMAAAVDGSVDKTIITGGMANSELLIGLLMKKISFIAPIEIYPGEDEMMALAEGVSRVLKKEENINRY